MGALPPQVSLQGEISSLETFSDGLAGPETASIGLFVTIPLYTGGLNHSNVREAQAAGMISDSFSGNPRLRKPSL